MNYVHATAIENISGVTAGFSTRNGGLSLAPFASLNLSFSSGDSRSTVTENRRLLAEPLGFSLEQIAVAGLVHGKDVEVVSQPGFVPGVDGMVTHRRNILLCVTAADCAVLLMADTSNGIVGACHAGWRGAVAGVVPETVESMINMGARRGNLIAFVSPCISQERFEVGPEVASQFDGAFVAINPDTKREHVDLRGAIVKQLLDSGISRQSIEVSPDCTYRDTSTYFSHRAENGQTGRMMGFIGMRAEESKTSR